ncbi:MAG: hypothetical protein GY765_42405 [bacterium]|nr:hypothetical protein [bacterium]
MKFKSIVLAAYIGLLTIGGGLAVHARLVANSSPIAFEDEGETSSTTEAMFSRAGSYTLRELVIVSAGYYLKGQSYINALSEKVELSDIQKTDFYTIRGDANSSLENIYNAWYYYRQLESKANYTPYNQEIIKRLAGFDYDRFQEKNGLIKDVFKDVKAYLVKGDVRGVYSRISGDIENIYFILEDVQMYLYWDIIPDNETMWNLNQQCAKTLLFGQYVARVFGAIK